MKEDDISPLLQRYLVAREKGKEPYFDADEIDELLNSFEESDYYQYYDEILALGLKLHPGNTDLQIKQCKQYVDYDDYESALALIDSIAETHNESLDLLRLECYCMMDRYDKLIEYTERLMEEGCGYLRTIFEGIAPILNDAEMYHEANDFLSRGLNLFPDNIILKDELCYAKESLGDLTGAIQLCNELIDKNPYGYQYWATLGRLYSLNSEFEKAIEAFDFALTCDDSETELKTFKAYCLYRNGSYEKALEVYREVCTDNEVEQETLDHIKPLMAECYIRLENFKEAYNVLKEIIGQPATANEPNAYINYVRCCAEMERDEEARDTLLKAIALFPENVRILSLLALTYVQNGEEELAIETTDRLFNVLEEGEGKFEPHDYESLFHAGNYLYLKGDIQKALKFYQKAYAFNPKLPYIHLHLAMAYLSAGDMRAFVEHIRQTSPAELIEYMTSAGVDVEKIKQQIKRNQIPPEDLVKEFLKNKDNNN